DHAMALLLALARGITRLDTDVKAGGWDLAAGRPIRRLRGRRLGVVGFGRIGRAVAERAAAFGLEVVAHDPYVDPASFPPGEAPKLVDFDEIVRTADAITLHAPLTSETRYLIGAAELKKMKPSAYLINTCRGPVVDEIALAQALNAGEIAGAGIDVLEREPPPKDHPIRSARNIILTPHAAFSSEESMLELERRTAGCVADVLRGKIPENVRNPEVLESTDLRP
ncbi:unnamed protein product, partial [marine sediment metagenome]